MDSTTPARRTGAGDWRRGMIVHFVQEFGNREGHPASTDHIE